MTLPLEILGIKLQYFAKNSGPKSVETPVNEDIFLHSTMSSNKKVHFNAAFESLSHLYACLRVVIMLQVINFTEITD